MPNLEMAIKEEDEIEMEDDPNMIVTRKGRNPTENDDASLNESQDEIKRRSMSMLVPSTQANPLNELFDQ